MIVRPSIAFNGFSGSAGEVTARDVDGRTVLSGKSQQSKTKTPAQAVRRNTLSRISRSYRQLSDSQMKGWETLSEHMKGISTFGEAAKMTAHNAFVRINTNRALAGMSPLSTAPVYTSDVPEVDYDDFWVTPERIIFVGLNQPSEHHRLVMKMSRTESTGVSSGWGNTVIVAPAFSPDWGDADITQSYLSTIGFLPVAGQKYFLSFWWMDTETGFTGESMAVSVICQKLSAVRKEIYTPRNELTLDNISSLSSEETVGKLYIEQAPGPLWLLWTLTRSTADMSPASAASSRTFLTPIYPDESISRDGATGAANGPSACMSCSSTRQSLTRSGVSPVAAGPMILTTRCSRHQRL